MDDNEVIAVLLSGYDDEGRQRATVLLRDAQGQLSLRHMGSPEASVQQGDRMCRPGRPIRDPQSREVMGCEMEWVRAAH